MYYLRDKQNSFWGMFNASNTARPIHWLGVIILIFLLMSSFFHLEKFFSLTFLWAMFSMVWPFSKPQGRPVAALSRREGAGPASITTLSWGATTFRDLAATSAAAHSWYILSVPHPHYQEPWGISSMKYTVSRARRLTLTQTQNSRLRVRCYQSNHLAILYLPYNYMTYYTRN